MAKVFLDTNYLIDTLVRTPEKEILSSLIEHIVYTSTLSFHIYVYVYKIKIPNKMILGQREKFQIVDISERILDLALKGPTDDLEDNIQLHCASTADCDIFLTSDQKLLKLKFFGKTELKFSLK